MTAEGSSIYTSLVYFRLNVLNVGDNIFNTQNIHPEDGDSMVL